MSPSPLKGGFIQALWVRRGHEMTGESSPASDPNPSWRLLILCCRSEKGGV